MIVEATKRCSGCKQSLPIAAFHKNCCNPDGLHYRCRSCRAAAEQARLTVPENRKRKRELFVQWKYGADEFLANRLLRVPVCQSCGVEFALAGDERIDHCHENGHVRGVLCHRCNVAASGTSEEAIPRLLGLVAYLERDLEWQSL